MGHKQGNKDLIHILFQAVCESSPWNMIYDIFGRSDRTFTIQEVVELEHNDAFDWTEWTLNGEGKRSLFHTKAIQPYHPIYHSFSLFSSILENKSRLLAPHFIKLFTTHRVNYPSSLAMHRSGSVSYLFSGVSMVCM
jgi:hypothetical protein